MSEGCISRGDRYKTSTKKRTSDSHDLRLPLGRNKPFPSHIGGKQEATCLGSTSRRYLYSNACFFATLSFLTPHLEPHLRRWTTTQPDLPSYTLHHCGILVAESIPAVFTMAA